MSDLKTLVHLTLTPVRGNTHAERIENFYVGQADSYDGFRRKLLHGRETLYGGIPIAPGGRWLDMGGGTGVNVECLEPRLSELAEVTIVDLAPSLLAIALRRIARAGWRNVRATHGDATTFRAEPVDVITFSYSLTMIPSWMEAIDHAITLLKPGGIIGVVDFYVSPKFPPPGRIKHGWLTRTFWPTWFGLDNVFPNPDHVEYLHRRFEAVSFQEGRGKVPYMLGLTAPYYLFIGRKRRDESVSVG